MMGPPLGHHQQPLPHLLQQDQRCLCGRFLVYRQHHTLCASGPRRSTLSNAGCHTGESTCCRASTAGCGTGATWQKALERKGVGCCSQQLPATGVPSGYSGGELTTASSCVQLYPCALLLCTPLRPWGEAAGIGSTTYKAGEWHLWLIWCSRWRMLCQGAPSRIGRLAALPSSRPSITVRQ